MPNMPFRSRLAVQCILQILLEIARSLEVELGVLDTHLDHVALLSEEEFLRAEAEQAEDVLEFGGDVFWEDGARWCEELVYSVDVGHVCDVLSIVAEDCRGPRGHCRRDTLYIRAACPERQIDTLKIMLPKLLHTLSCTISLYLQLFDLTPNHPPAIDASPFRRLPAKLRNVIFEQALHKPDGINMLTAQWHQANGSIRTVYGAHKNLP